LGKATLKNAEKKLGFGVALYPMVTMNGEECHKRVGNYLEAKTTVMSAIALCHLWQSRTLYWRFESYPSELV